jgi:ABC-2 type transport system permease protein
VEWMKGLFYKDYKLILAGRSNFNLIFLAVICSVFAGADADPYSGYYGICLVTVLASVGVRNYDVCDNGLAYLFTLPISRRGYVRESYLFSLVSAGVTFIAWSIFNGMLNIVFQADHSSLISFIGMSWDFFKLHLIMIAFLIPFYLFLGGKKSSQYILIVVSVILIFVIYTGSMPLYGWLEKGIRLLKVFPVTVLLMAGSYLISVMIMERKDF